jgi:hypothetical protein
MAQLRIPVEQLPPPNQDGNHSVRVRILSDDISRTSAFTTRYVIESKGQIWPLETIAEIYKASASVINVLWDTPTTYNVKSKTRINYISNPSFETNIRFWQRSPSSLSSPAIRTTSDALFGVASLQMTKIAIASGITTSTIAFTIDPGKQYIASSYVKVPAGQEETDILCRMQFLNFSGLPVGDVINGSVENVSSADGWKRVSVVGTSPENVSRIIVGIGEASPGTPGQTFLIDGALLEEGSSLQEYFDGSTSASTGVLVNSWTKTSNSSPSIQILEEKNTDDLIVHNHGAEWKVHDSDIYVQWDSGEFEYYGRNRDNDIGIIINPGSTTVRVWGQVANYFPKRDEKFKIFDTGTRTIASL